MTRSTLLWIFLTLFVLRVLGQLLVVNHLAPFLPPMEEWQSGWLPYPLLLASQIAIVAVLGTVCIQFSRGKGYFVRPRARLATPMWILGWIYAVGMVVRYAMLRRELIPVTFHIVLASFLLVVAHHHRTHRYPTHPTHPSHPSHPTHPTHPTHPSHLTHLPALPARARKPAAR